MAGGERRLDQSEMPAPAMWSVFRGIIPPRLVPACAAVAVLATALFFLLHHFGNQLPYDLAMQRFQAEFESGSLDEPNVKGNLWEYCQISGAVLIGAEGGDGESAVRNAVVLMATPAGEAPNTTAVCDLFEAAAHGVVSREILNVRFWWGAKSLYAIALRYVSTEQFREIVLIATRVSYLLLGASLYLLSPTVLLLAAPLLVFGAFFSSIDYWADVSNGLPYLWTVLFAAGLALLTRRTGRGRWTGAPPVCCFAAGTVSSYLWLGDGHTFFAVVWIGIVVWFGCGVARGERTKRAVSCIVFYGAGLVVCHTLGYAVKAMFLGEHVWVEFLAGVDRAVGQSSWLVVTAWPEWPYARHVTTYHDGYYAMAWPGWLPAGVVPTSIAACALAVSLGIGVFEARRGRPDLLWGVLWIVCLVLISSSTFLIWDDMPSRTAKWLFVPLGLCLCSLVLALRTAHWRMSLATAGKLSAVLLGTALVVGWVVAWYLPIESRATARLIESVEDTPPVVRSTFDVYLDENRLVYVNEECRDEDVDAKFFLHLYPVDAADLPAHRRQYGFDNLDFSFRRSGGLRGAARCAVERTIPDYGIVAIETGQFVNGKGQLWSGRVSLKGPRALAGKNLK